MGNYIPRIPVEDEYLIALGRATYNFTYLEWGIVWLTEILNPGFLARAESMTAGQIAREFEQQVDKLDENIQDKNYLNQLASTFLNLKNKRNELLHGNPYTAENGEQRLLYSSASTRQDWTISEIVEVARSFEDAAIKAGSLLHNGRYELYQAQISK